MFNYTDSRSIYNTIVKIQQTWLTLSHTLSWAPVGRRAKHGQIQGVGLQRASQDSTKWGGGVAIFFFTFYFSKISLFRVFTLLRDQERPTFKNFTL